MSITATRWAARQKLPQSMKMVLLAYADFADADGIAWPSTARLSEYATLSKRAIQENRARLIKCGLIERHDDGSGNQYCIRLRFDVVISVPPIEGRKSKKGPSDLRAPPRHDAPCRADTTRPAALSDAPRRAQNAPRRAASIEEPPITTIEPPAEQYRAPALTTEPKLERPAARQPDDDEFGNAWRSLGVWAQRESRMNCQIPSQAVVGYARQWLADAMRAGMSLAEANRLCRETITRIVDRPGNSISTLKYFGNPISEAIAKWSEDEKCRQAHAELGQSNDELTDTEKREFARYCDDCRANGTRRMGVVEWLEAYRVAA